MSNTTQSDYIAVFICGSALRGQPDHGNLLSAKFVGEASTQARYRLHAVADGWHPGIYEVEQGGISIPGEVYEMTQAQFDHLAASEPPNMYPSDVILENRETVTAFLYPQALVKEFNWPDISEHGGWAAYKQAVTAQV
jgi:gamma-glutamylaminecyclotransferase